MNKIFWTSIEYSEFNQNLEDGIIGGFVYAFVNSKSTKDALNMFATALEKQNKSPKVFEFILLYPESTVWETEKQTEHYKSLYKISKLSYQVIFDDFYAYQKL